ncbi:hypothetical protein [Abyssalbus ytuae]|uniref:Uncharacterized protein n=1 Tax=Abyssalbus ytuae TaxID=2926907 RepID=A0A9E6ZY63_9FLAO|nr:hypothetical protein [Abyssalbus ytuae]UOB19111.1 hypothetical protein MQE35_07385 [Abyssalbus ytuae]
MTKRDLFRVLIKVFALYSIILTVFSWIPSNFIYTFYKLELIPVLATLGFTALAFLIYYILIKKTDQIIDFIKLDKGFDNPDLELGNLGTDKILMLGIILVGGLLFITNLADFIQYSFLAFTKEVQKGGLNNILNNSFGTTTDYFNWTFSGINILIGYLLLTNYDIVVKWLNRKEKNVG